MKYVTEITINLPQHQVSELFQDPASLPKWQPELMSQEPMSGEPGREGSQTRLKYQMDGRLISMTETILENKLPHTFCACYEAKGVFNTQDNHFEALSTTQTRWVSRSEFQFKGMMRFMAFFMSGAFKKQSLQYMQNFKKLAESELSVQIAACADT